MRSASIILSRSSPAWLANFQRLKARANYAIANGDPHSSAASSAATIDASGTLPGGMTTYAWETNFDKFLVTGGTPYNKPGTFMAFPSTSEPLAVTGNVVAGLSGVTYRVGHLINSQKIAWRMGGGPFRFIADGRYISKSASLLTGGGIRYGSLDFGSKGVHEVWIEGDFAGVMTQVAVVTGDTVTRADSSNLLTGVVLTDSFGITGMTLTNDGFAPIMFDKLGVIDGRVSSLGGTGHVNINLTHFNAPQRVMADVVAPRPHFVVVALGINDTADGAVFTNAADVLNKIQRYAPQAPIFVLGPWDRDAPSPPSANVVAVRDYISAACTGRSGVWFIDMTGVAYTKLGGGDVTHPDDPGHLTIGTYVSDQIKAIVGAA